MSPRKTAKGRGKGHSAAFRGLLLLHGAEDLVDSSREAVPALRGVGAHLGRELIEESARLLELLPGVTELLLLDGVPPMEAPLVLVDARLVGLVGVLPASIRL